MPDQSRAASEHALLQEITAPLATIPDDPLALVDAEFPTAMRGYDRHAVDDYVDQMSRLVAELHATRSPEAAVRRALERVGDQISGVLQRAHDTAEQITSQSRAEAEDRLERARREAASLVAAAERRVRELDADADRVWAERARIIADAETLSGELLAVARDAHARFPVPADEARAQPVLDHLTDPASDESAGIAESEAGARPAAEPGLGEEPWGDEAPWEGEEPAAVEPALDDPEVPALEDLEPPEPAGDEREPEPAAGEAPGSREEPGAPEGHDLLEGHDPPAGHDLLEEHDPPPEHDLPEAHDPPPEHDLPEAHDPPPGHDLPEEPTTGPGAVTRVAVEDPTEPIEPTERMSMRHDHSSRIIPPSSDAAQRRRES